MGVVFYQADHLKPVKFSDNSVIGFATICRGSKRLFAINRGDRPITFQLPKGFTEAIEQLTIECPPEKLLPLSTELIQRGKLRNSDIILPAYSISVVASNSDTEM